MGAQLASTEDAKARGARRSLGRPLIAVTAVFDLRLIFILAKPVVVYVFTICRFVRSIQPFQIVQTAVRTNSGPYY